MNEIKAMLAKLHQAGYDSKRTAQGHFKIYDRGRLIATLPRKTGQHRILANMRSHLRRAGAPV